MPLSPVRLDPTLERPPADIRRFLRLAERRIDRWKRSHRRPAFVACDFVSVYAALRAVDDADLLSGRWFCEWGSGFGVVACLAASLGLEACGIESDADLVEAARTLADDFEYPVEYACGSFIPDGIEGNYTWLNTDASSGYEELGLGPDEFDLIFAYPWPDEETLMTDLFVTYARPGALLLTYHPSGALNLWRK